MAVFKLISNPYDTDEALQNVVNYILNPKKSLGYVGAQNMLLCNPINQINAVQKFYYKQSGKQVWHFIISFDELEAPYLAAIYFLSYDICSFFAENQMIFAVHCNTAHPHVHFALLPINLATGKKVSFDHATLFEFLKYIRGLLRPFGISLKSVWGDMAEI